MNSIHAKRWIENFEHSDHDLYWYDILGRGQFETLETVKQILNTSKRKLPYIKGEYLLSKKTPRFYNSIRRFLQVTENEALEKIIKEIKPDVIHSFEMQSCTYAIVKTMNKFPNIKWIYSCWGTDLYYYQNFKNHKKKIKEVLKRINYLHTDCQRDYNIAIQLGFKGRHLGVIPGGGGYDMGFFKKHRKPLKDRKVIIIKGYQHKFGRALKVIQALQTIQKELKGFQIVIFGAHKEVLEYVLNNDLPFVVHQRDTISHEEIIEIMGESAIYIGNSISDGIPNTLLEAMFMGCFPIQSNPGDATAEIIKNGINGILIEKPEDEDHIKEIIIEAVQNVRLREIACSENQLLAKTYLDYHLNQQKILGIYEKIEEE